ncbi:hypothetical protein JCM5350_005920 [Sporobolomyces pararoseus]
MNLSSKQSTPTFSLFPGSSSSTSKSSNISTTQQLAMERESTSRSIIKLKESVWGDLAKVAGMAKDRTKAQDVVSKNAPLSHSKGKRKRTDRTEGENEKTKESRAHTREMEKDKEKRSVRRKTSSSTLSSSESLARPPDSTKTECLSSSSHCHHRSRRDGSSASPSRRSPPTKPRKRLLSRPRLRPYSTGLYKSLTAFQELVPESDYGPFLIPRSKIDPHLTFDFHYLPLAFYTSLVSQRNWSSLPKSRTFNRPVFSRLNETLLELDLDTESIRKDHPLVSTASKASMTLTGPEIALKGALEWIYGCKVKDTQIFDFVETSPLPLLVLARMHSDTIRYANAVKFALSEFETYLFRSPPPNLTKLQHRGRSLIEWLLEESSSRLENKGTRWKMWWSEEVERNREGKRSMTKCWMESDQGWENFEALDRWEMAEKEKEK